jgi:hypothetical protein
MLTEVSKAGRFRGLVTLALDGDVPAAALGVENAPPASAIIARLGDLERLAQLQLALSEEHRAAAEAAAASQRDAEGALAMHNSYLFPA